jgi:vitellogenic carboxypeptidase-like protein
MSTRHRNEHFGGKTLFSLAKNLHQNSQNEEYKKVGAWFLGPKGENEALLQNLIGESIAEHALYRSTHYKKGDPAYIDETIKDSPEYSQACGELQAARRELAKKLHGCVPFFSPRYQAHMNWDTVLPANVGYITAMLYNQNNVATEGGPATCALEKEVGEQLCGMLGFRADNSWGHITADGTIANLETMWMARNLKFYPLAIKETLEACPELARAKNEVQVTVWEPEQKARLQKKLVDCSVWQLLNLDGDESIALPGKIIELCGISQDEFDGYIAPYLLPNKGLMNYARKYPQIANVRVFVPATKHYSWPKAGTILGLGQDSIVGIPVDDRCHMDIGRLEEELAACVKDQIPVLMSVAVIGSTEEGVVDNLEGILALRENFAKEKGLNFLIHCDAAWGGYLRSMLIPAASGDKSSTENGEDDGFVPFVPLSAYAQKQYGLIHKADTVTIDPHKAGFVPYPAGSLCYRNGLMRYMITFNAAYIHSDAALNMGIFGVEGSKPGAAPAAVWMAHKTIPLDQSGYGQLLGECTFSTKLYYCYWLTLATEEDNFRIEPLIPLPEKLYDASGQVLANGTEEIINYIKINLIGKTNEELAAPESLAVLQQIGSDVLINSFTVNFKVNGIWNQDLALMNQFNTKLAELFSITTPEQAEADKADFILTSSTLTADEYRVPLARIYKNLGIKPSGDGSVNFLINTILQPWPTTHEFIQTIMSAFKAGIKQCLPQVETSLASVPKETASEDRVLRIPADATAQPARWYSLENSYAGYATADENGNSLFYWFFSARQKAYANTPLIIWLNGGPGASSLAGLFLENGPFTVLNDATVVPNPNSWNQEAHMLFWDQPAGTGYSNVSPVTYINTEEEMAAQFVTALQNFYSKHPEYRSNPVYLTGESYAGKYIPYIAREISRRNQAFREPPINLKGMAIGDGWMYPERQTKDQIEYAFMLGFIDTLQKQTAEQRYLDFQRALREGRMDDATQEGMALSDLLVHCGGGENVYDVRSWSDAPIDPLRTYLSGSRLKDCIHVPQAVEWAFADASGPVSEHLTKDLMASVTALLPELVSETDKDGTAKYRMLFYTGNFDMSCGFTGTEEILRNMEWNGKEIWTKLRRGVWYKMDSKGNKQTQGCIKNYANLTQIEIPMSGHQVPLYQPAISREMIYNWIFQRSFAQYDPLKE